MGQDRLFLEGEGDRWFNRNRDALDGGLEADWPLRIVRSLARRSELRSVVELGCANGYRLAALRDVLDPGCRMFGVDASDEAIVEGRSRYPGIEFRKGLLSDIPLSSGHDLVIVHFVLHWVERESLARSVAEIDRIVTDGGFLIPGDFLPDYPRIFISMGTYREVWRVAYGYREKAAFLDVVPSNERCFCALLSKSSIDCYPEVS